MNWIIFIFLISFAGLILTLSIIPERSFIEILSIGFALGIFFITFTSFILLSLDRPLSFNFIVLTTYAFLILSLIFGGKNFINKIENKRLFIYRLKEYFSSEKLIYKLILISTTLLFVFIIIIAVYWPITDWDALALYDLRGRLLSQGYLFNDLAKLDRFDPNNPGYYFSYPLLTSIFHAQIYLLGGRSPQVLYPLTFILLGLFFYSTIKKRSGNYAIFYTYLFIFTPNILRQAIISYTNLIYIFYYFLSTVILSEILANKSNRSQLRAMFISGILLGGSIWSRSVEPFYLVNILFLLFWIIKNKQGYIYFPAYIFFPLLVRYLWKNTALKYANSFFINSLNINIFAKVLANFKIEYMLEAIKIILLFLQDNIILFALLSTVGLISLLQYKSKVIKSDFLRITATIFMMDMVVLFLGTLIVSIEFQERKEIFDSISRTGLFIYPFSYLLVAIGNPLEKMIVKNKH